MFWDSVEIKEGCACRWQIGPLTLRVRRMADEWHTAFQRGEDTGELVFAKPEEPPEDITWTRWASIDGDYTFAVKPILPDRPVIVRPESPFAFPAKSNLFFYVSIPVWMGMRIGHDSKTVLRDEPSVVLSNSWFGEPFDGTLAYALKTTARRTPADLRVRPHLAACPIHIRNQTTGLLMFERICIHSAHLGLYADQRRLYTSQMEVLYKGVNEPALTQYPQVPPAMAEQAQVLRPASVPARQGLLQKQFADLKSFVRI